MHDPDSVSRGWAMSRRSVVFGGASLVMLAGAAASLPDEWIDRLSLQQQDGGIVDIPAPDQETIDSIAKAPMVVHRDDRGELRALAIFRVQGIVLANSRYRFDKMAQWSPLDLAIGWGPLGTRAVREAIEFRQDGRWYTFRIGQHSRLNIEQVRVASANMHLIPASEPIRKMLLALRREDEVEIQGYLVQVRSSEGWQLSSSTIRTDTGSKACEVVYVTYVRDTYRDRAVQDKMLYLPRPRATKLADPT